MPTFCYFFFSWWPTTCCAGERWRCLYMRVYYKVGQLIWATYSSTTHVFFSMTIFWLAHLSTIGPTESPSVYRVDMIMGCPKSNRTPHQLPKRKTTVGLLSNLHMKCVLGPPLPPNKYIWSWTTEKNDDDCVVDKRRRMRASFAFLCEIRFRNELISARGALKR